MIYSWAKIIHILAIISWMAGILYLYRLLIYRVERGSNEQKIDELLTLMAERLYRYITVPAMSVAYIAGFFMVFSIDGMVWQGWLQTKVLFVVMLTAFTIYAGKINRRMTANPDLARPSGTLLRIYNEIPTFAMIVIVILVILKPF